MTGGDGGKGDPRVYWNDMEVEKRKAFFVTGPEDMRLLSYLREQTGLERCFLDAVSFVEERLGGMGRSVLDVAAGVCWTSALISRRPGVGDVVAVDYSAHRLFEIAPVVIKQMGGDAGKIRRIAGDFMEMELPPESFDTVVFCQALYMFSDIGKALSKASSALRPGGRLIVACERLHPPSFLSAEFMRQVFTNPKYALWSLAVRARLRPRRDETGRHILTDGDYRESMEKAGFEFYFQPLSYKLWDSLPVNAGNYLGLKR